MYLEHTEAEPVRAHGKKDWNRRWLKVLEQNRVQSAGLRKDCRIVFGLIREALERMMAELKSY